MPDLNSRDNTTGRDKTMFEKGLLKGKRILVTGGGSGLGAAMGRRFLELGADLIICGRRLELRALGADCAQPLAEARPLPRLDLAVARFRLTPRRLEVLEPGVGLLDQQQLLGFT